jgi:hypothetical protein
VANRFDGRPAIGECRRQDLSNPRDACGQLASLDEHSERVARLDVAAHVNAELEDVGD